MLAYLDTSGARTRAGPRPGLSRAQAHISNIANYIWDGLVGSGAQLGGEILDPQNDPKMTPEISPKCTPRLPFSNKLIIRFHLSINCPFIPFGPGDHMGPGPMWARGPFGPGAHVGPGPKWARPRKPQNPPPTPPPRISLPCCGQISSVFFTSPNEPIPHIYIYI